MSMGTLGRFALRCGVGFTTALLVSGCMAEKLARRAAFRDAQAEQTAQRVAEGSACCSTYGELVYTPLEAGNEFEVVLRKGSPLFDFPFGRSRLKALALPPLSSGDALRVSAVELVSGDKPIFRPVVILLSERHEPIGEPIIPVYDDRFMKWSSEGHAATIALDGALAGARYLIVAADPAYVGKSFVREAATSIMPVAGTTIFLPIHREEMQYAYGYEGLAYVTVGRRRR